MRGYETAKLNYTENKHKLAELVIESGDAQENELYFRIEDITMIAVMNYVDEQEAAPGQRIPQQPSRIVRV